MATLSFTNRFRNKIEKIGKEGITSLNASNPIEKSEIPESKLHKPLLKVRPSASKLMISSKLQESDKISQVSTTNSYRSITPFKGLPSIRISPTRILEYSSRSKSPLDISESYLNKEGSQENSFSCVKLPRINSGSYNLRANFKSRVK